MPGRYGGPPAIPEFTMQRQGIPGASWLDRLADCACSGASVHKRGVVKEDPPQHFLLAFTYKHTHMHIHIRKYLPTNIHVNTCIPTHIHRQKKKIERETLQGPRPATPPQPVSAPSSSSPKCSAQQNVVGCGKGQSSGDPARDALHSPISEQSHAGPSLSPEPQVKIEMHSHFRNVEKYKQVIREDRRKERHHQRSALHS